MNAWDVMLNEATAKAQADVEFPLGSGVRCVLVHEFLSALECDRFIRRAEEQGFASANPDFPPSYRDNDRLVVDDVALAGHLFERLRRYAETCSSGLSGAMSEPGWSVMGVNERVRFCRYRPGTQFHAHQDGVYYRPGSQSRLTFMIYLNDDDFAGGETEFFENRSDAMESRNPVLRLRPRRGSLILFDHSIWHAGSVVHSGIKYVMRSDVIYTEDHLEYVAGPFKPGHRGKVWALTTLQGFGIASGGRDTTIRLWDIGGAPIGILEGHTQSVLGLLEMEPGEVISYSRDRTIRRWSLATGKSEVVGTADSAVISAARLDGRRLVTGDAAGHIAIWDVGTASAEKWRAHGCWVWAIAALPNGNFATASEDGCLRTWQADGSRLAGVELAIPLRALDSCTTPRGPLLAVGDIDGNVHLLLAGPALERIGCIALHDGPVRRIRFESEHVVLTCGEDGFVRRWDLDLQQGSAIARHENFATDVICTGQRRWVSCGYDGRIETHYA